MFGAKCSLCNGKLDSRKICKECGLDNSKSEKYYKINRSSCDDLPMTHVHEEEWQEVKSVKKKSAPPKMAKYAYQTSQSQKTRSRRAESDDTKKKGVMGIVSVLCVLIPAMVGVIGNLTGIGFSNPEPDYSVEAVYDPYEYVEAELPELGDNCMYTLYSGQYVVGVHIAEGYYEATLLSESDSIEVTDTMNGIYLYQSMYDDNYLDDLRLFEGAVITITSQEGIRFDTENGQTGEMSALVENFVTDTYKLIGYDEAEAGVDFEPGIYDLSAVENYSYVELTIYDVDGSEWDFRSFDLGKEGVHGSEFCNVVIPEGAIISCDDGTVHITPSEWIWTTDYLEHYY